MMNISNIVTNEQIQVKLQQGDFVGDLSKELIKHLKNTLDPFENKAYVYSPNDATVIGLFTKMYKYFRLLIDAHYRLENESVFLLCRPIYEAFVIFKYLIIKGEDSQRHYRLIAYRRRYEMLIEYERGDKYGGYGNVVMKKIEKAMEQDGFSIEDFKLENSKQRKGRKWQLDGKTFADIHQEVEYQQTYKYIYGIFSDIIHSSWMDISQLHLIYLDGNCYTPKLEMNKYDETRIISPIISMLLEAVVELLTWAERNDELNVYDEFKRVNNLIIDYIKNKYENDQDCYLYS